MSLQSKRLFRTTSVTLALSLVLPVWIATPAMAQPIGLPSLGSNASADLSPLTEQRLGELIMRQGRLDPTYVHDVEINQYLNQLGQKLARHAVGGTPSVELFAVRDPAFNAFAMPGGYIGINTGVIAISERESELAGVVAHEISHVTQRHIARGLTQRQQTSALMLASIAGALLAALAGGAGLAAGVAAFGQAAAIDRQLGFSRDAESEADRVGLQMMAKAGFDPTGLQSMFEKLMHASNLNMGQRGGNTYLSTHPLSMDRMTDMQNRTRSLPASNYQDSRDFAYVRARALVAQATNREDIRRLQDRLADEARRGSSSARSAANLALSELASRQGDHNLARAYLQKAREAGDSAYIARQDAWLQLVSGQPQAAQQTARQALSKWPNHVALAEVQARALSQMGQPAQAAKVLEGVLKRWPEEFPSLYQQRANALMQANEPIRGREVMAQYYVLTGAFPAAIAQLEQAREMTKDFREQSVLDVRIREVRQQMAQEREILERFGG